MFKKSFENKIVLSTVIVSVALMTTLIVFLSVRFMECSDSLIHERLVACSNSLKYYLDNIQAHSEVAVVSMAFNANVIRAVKERDTKDLLRFFSSMRDFYHVDYYTITDNEGTVLARTYEPESFGDAILEFQNVKDALDGKVSSYFETGTVVQLTVCTGAPVYDREGALVGAVLAGKRLDSDSAVEELKNLLDSEVTIYKGDTKIAATIAKETSGAEYRTIHKPLLNAQNDAFASIVLSIPLTELKAASKRSIQGGIMIGAVGLILSLVLLSFIISSISKPILLLSNEMDRFANGNLNIDLDIKNGDEVGRLGKSLQKAVNIIRSLHHEIDIMIAEQAKGNTDYVLNTEEFHGEYQLLAKHILELSSLGMRDSLTGMPNRRSFDNRLKTEWNRAKREETPISILMIDIDKFKDYNDAYGHLQGDKALQTIAKAFAQSIKRTVDFAARWGGEEFIVLLPNTNLNGALIVAEQIRTKIENMVIPCDEEKFGKEAEKITVSIGVETQIPAQVSGPVNLVDSLILNADKALYQAKETGRNRVCRYGEGLSRR